MNQTQINLRAVTLADAEMILNWRNAPETRRYSFSTAIINWSEHIAWLKKTINSTVCYMLIAELDKQPVGVIRFAEKDETTVEVSIYLDPAMLGRGLGAIILNCGTEWIKNNLPAIKKMHAKIIPENVASLKVFEKAGYQVAFTVYEKLIT